ncbi:uncharacterized protein Cp7Fb [Calliphora vicina]|uniref:uncharacterized protein Cp7Fb n=1 Tax=Calliphora vicina TaxID=7373 RepID=UPI00325A9F20
MKLNNLLISSVIGVILISCVHAGPIEVIYSGDSCDCPKNLDYLVNLPPPPVPKEFTPSEYGYKLDVPLQAKAKVTYSFDFTVEEPKAPPPPPEDKLEIFAKIDRMTAHKKDCLAAKALPNTCSCNRCIAKRQVSPEDRATRYARSFLHPNSIDNMTPSTSQIMAIFLEPLKQTQLGASKTRNKRDISRIFMRPRKNEKRSDRVVKQYNKRLKDQPSNKAFLAETPKPIRSRSIAAAAPPTNVRPLQQLTSFLTLPRFRNKRDIKGEYDLIEKEREQMDLTLPEIIQYMPETLDPNFKRNQCHFGQRCQLPDLTESTTTTTTTTTSTASETTTTTSTDSIDTTQETLSVTDAPNNEEDVQQEVEEEHETALDNSISSTHTKRNAADYGGAGGGGGCPLVFNSYNPTPSPGYTFEPLTSFEAIPRPFATANNPYGADPVPQQYVGAPHNPYASTILDSSPLVGAAYPNPSVQPVSNAQLDQIISEIVNRHTDFIEASSHRGGAYTDPVGVQEQQAKSFLKNLMGGWFGAEQQPQYQAHAHIPHYNAPAAGPLHSPPPYYP